MEPQHAQPPRGTRTVPLGIVAAGVALLALVAWMVAIEPAAEYRLSFYENVPLVTWPVLAAVLVSGTALATFGAVRSAPRWYWPGIALAVLANLLAAFLPSMRGFVLTSIEDNAAHVAFATDILRSGHIPAADFYPLTHVLTAEIALLGNVSIYDAAFLPSKVFYLILLAGTWCLARHVAGERVAMFALLAAVPLFAQFYVSLFPFGFACMVLPFILFAFMRTLERRTWVRATFALLLVTFTVILHPVGAFFMVGALVLIQLVHARLHLRASPRQAMRISSIPLVAGLILFAWIFSYQRVYGGLIRSTQHLLLLEAGTTSLAQSAESAVFRLGLSLIQIALVGAFLYGQIALYGLLSAVALFLVWRTPSGLPRLRVLGLSLVPLLAIWLIDYVFPVTLLRSGRLQWLVIPLFFPLLGFLLWRFVQGKDHLRLRALAIVALMATTGLVGLATYRQSPLVLLPDPSITEAAAVGGAWFATYVPNARHPPIHFTLNTPLPYRYAQITLGFEAALQAIPIDLRAYYPYHFGYDVDPLAGDSIERGAVILARPDHTLALYEGMWRGVGRFQSSDFERLAQDPTASRVYDNGEVWVLYVRPRL